MEREDFGALSASGEATDDRSKRVGRASAQPARARKNEDPALPFWLVTVLFLGLPVTLAGILLVTWMVLFD